MTFETIGSPLLWGGFVAFILAMLAIDLGVFHRRAHEVSLKEAGIWSAVWVALAAAFTVGVYAWFGPQRALEFTTGVRSPDQREDPLPGDRLRVDG